MATYNLNTHTTRSAPWGDRVERIMDAALQAVEPGGAVSRYLQRDGDRLSVQGQEYDLSQYRRVWIVGAGKASAPMAEAAVEIVGDDHAGGLVIVKEGHTDVSQIGKVSIAEAGHPIPDERGVRNTQELMSLLEETREDDLVIGLISGGGSALMTAPDQGLTLADVQQLTSALLACGATIYEINALRKHLDRVKGGGLAEAAAPAALVTLILSDVIGDPLDVIASGPTAPDGSTFQDAVDVLDKYEIREEVPQAIFDHLQRGLQGELPETPKPGDALFSNVQNVIVGSNLQAAQAALSQAEAEGFHTLLLTTSLQGEARHAGRFLAAIAQQIVATGQPLPRPACIVVGGETTVTLRGDGLGGRNQELVLAAVEDVAGLPDVALVTLATDGDDGPTDAAGAVVTGETLSRAREAGLDPAQFLTNNDSYHFFAPLDDLLRPGPTQTNVNDLAFVLAF